MKLELNSARILASAFAVAAFAAAAIATAMAHDGATGIVKDRMDKMSAMGKATKSIALMVKGDRAFDAKVMQTELAKISNHSGDNLTRLFPAGSISATSAAKQEIWRDWEKFEALSAELNRQAITLAAQGSKPTPARFGKLAATCKGCHEQFRARKQ
jgi:cytochrome c556